jgi:hypothetical protein
MYPYYQGVRRQLSSGDLERLRALYGFIPVALKVIRRKKSQKLDESDHQFVCPRGTVMTGQLHSGDENGDTWYEYAELRRDIDGARVVLENHRWHQVSKESAISFRVPRGRVLVGRRHDDDENGMTSFYTATARIGDARVELASRRFVEPHKLVDTTRGRLISYHFTSPANRLMTGYRRRGDENQAPDMEHGIATVLTQINTLYAFVVTDDGEEANAPGDEMDTLPSDV